MSPLPLCRQHSGGGRKTTHSRFPADSYQFPADFFHFLSAESALGDDGGHSGSRWWSLDVWGVILSLQEWLKAVLKAPAKRQVRLLSWDDSVSFIAESK